MYHQWLRPLPAAFGKKILVVLFCLSWAPAVMPQCWAGWSCSLGGSSLCLPMMHVAGHWSRWEADSATCQAPAAAVAREELAGKSLLGMGREAGGWSFMLCSSAWVRAVGRHRNTPLQWGFSRNVFIYIKTLLYKLKERKRKKKRDDVLEGQVCQSQRPSLPPHLTAAFLPLWSNCECRDPCRKIPSQPSLSVNIHIFHLSGFQKYLFSASKENSCPNVFFLIYLCNTV